MGVDLSYKEKQERLANRIRAHKLFANFDIESWIERFLGQRPRRAILDVGCGDGNHLGLYLRHVPADGIVAGIDREPSLIAAAAEGHPGDRRLDLRVGSMDDPLPFADAAFDTAFSNFAIYNARDPRAALTEIRRVMAPGAELVLIGPTANNAREIYEYNQRLTGTAIDEVTLIRTDRLRREILPVAREVFSSVREEVINSYLTFPDVDEFLRYFKSTMLYEEGAERAGVTDERMRAACERTRDTRLSKEMLALVALRS